MENQGKCLCGDVKFVISDDFYNIYQCHCSECRKVSGSSSNSSCIIPSDKFKWISGENNIASYKHSSGYRSDFCKKCGSPTPNITTDEKFYWVPAGLLGNTNNLKINAHLCVNSKAEWEQDIKGGKKYGEMPDSFEELVGCL
jgi:hypothetical protein